MDQKTRDETVKALLAAATALEAGGASTSANADKVRQLIQQNHHGEAVQMLASLAKVDAKLFKAVKAMNEIQDYFGSLPQGLDYVRSALSKRVKAHLTHKTRHLDEDEKAELIGLL